MELSDIKLIERANKGAEMRLRHPGTDEVSDAVIGVMGYDSEPVLNAVRNAQKALLSSKQAEKLGADELLRTGKVAAAKAAINSVNNLTFHGELIATPDALREYLDDPNYFWIVEQVDAFGSDRANLFTDPPKS